MQFTVFINEINFLYTIVFQMFTNIYKIYDLSKKVKKQWRIIRKICKKHIFGS